MNNLSKVELSFSIISLSKLYYSLIVLSRRFARTSRTNEYQINEYKL